MKIQAIMQFAVCDCLIALLCGQNQNFDAEVEWKLLHHLLGRDHGQGNRSTTPFVFSASNTRSHSHFHLCILIAVNNGWNCVKREK